MILRESIGLLASIFVMLSYIFEGTKLRIVNLVGSILFVIYGFMFNGISVIILNSSAIVLHLYYIMKEIKNKQ